ncbi:MAG TPA: response regulator [Bdellovibrionota bacterium]|jgi:DNA-binding NtrC family response regulator
MKKILILDDELELRQSLAATLEMALPVECVQRARKDDCHQDESRLNEFHVAVLDINLGHGLPTGLDAYFWLRLCGYQGRCIFITGHALEHPLAQEAARLPGVEIFEKPVEVRRLIGIIKEALGD